MGWTRGMGKSFKASVFVDPSIPALPAIMRERTVGFRHPVNVLTLLDGIPPAIRCVKQLRGESLRHRLLVTLARGRNDPANTERLAAVVTHLDRHLIGRTADATRTHLDRGHDIVERLLEDRDWALLGLAF